MTKKKEDDTSYSFLLKCMAALTAASIITAGIIIAATLKSAALATAAFTGHTLLASAFIFTPVFPIALITIGLVFVLPFLFACNKNTSTTVTATPSYRNYDRYSFYNPPSFYYPGHYDSGSVIYTGVNHTHEHPGSSGTMQGHDTNIHEHNSHRHGHY